MVSKLDQAKKDLLNLKDKEVLKNPLAIYNVKRMTIDGLFMRLENAFIKGKNSKKEKFIMLVSKLDALSPLKILKRGYSMTCDETGQPISSVKKVEIGSKINVSMEDGSLSCSVYGVKEG